MNLRGMRTKEPAEGKSAQTILYIRTVVTLRKRRLSGGRPRRRGLDCPRFETRIGLRLRFGQLLGRDRCLNGDGCKRIDPGADTDRCRNTSTAPREPDGVLLLERASDHC